MSDIDELAETSQTPKKPRRWRRRMITSFIVLIVLLVAAIGGVGWYFSGEVVNVKRGDHDFPLTVQAVNGTEVTLPLTEETQRDGVWGLHWEDGRALLGDVLRIDGDSVVRPIQRVLYGTLTSGTKARIDTWAVGEDPESAFGIPFQTVHIATELGDAPAWYVPADGDTWVIAVHGRNAGPREALRIIPTLHEANLPVLAITHRNDQDAPASPDNMHHLGDTEWRDVSAAVDYAISQGAQDVVLYGWSMGGAVTMMALRHMEDSDVVSGMILDSPVLDWTSTLDKQGAQRSLPWPILSVAKWLVEWRAGLDLENLDQRAFAPDMTTPVLLFADTADKTVDVSATLEFAEAVPSDLMNLVVTSAGHTASWNHDPAGYESAVTKFLAG